MSKEGICIKPAIEPQHGGGPWYLHVVNAKGITVMRDSGDFEAMIGLLAIIHSQRGMPEKTVWYYGMRSEAAVKAEGFKYADGDVIEWSSGRTLLPQYREQSKYDNANADLWTDDDHPFSSDKKRDAFKSPYTEESKHNGRPFTILGLADRDKFDMHETGPYYRIRFEDGAKEEFDADPIEIYQNVGRVGGRAW